VAIAFRTILPLGAK